MEIQGQAQKLNSMPEVAEAAQITNNNAFAHAGFWARAAAMIIDTIIFGIASVFLTLFSGLSGLVSASEIENFGNSWTSQGIFTILGWIYYVFMTHQYQATLGKMAIGIKVINTEGGQQSIGRIILRETIGKFISGIIFAIGYFIAGFTKNKQGLHDMMAQTYVVRKDPSDKRTGLVITICILGSAVPIIGILASIVLVSLNSAQDKAQAVSVQAAVSSTVPAVVICLDEGKTVSLPKNDQPICEGNIDMLGTWPSLISAEGQWGGCPETFISDPTGVNHQFQYCATHKGEIITCTMKGCNRQNQEI